MRNKDKSSVITAKCTRLLLTVAVLLFGLAVSIPAQAFTVYVVDQDGDPVSDFKWVLQEDNTHQPMPGDHRSIDPSDVNNNTLAASIHKSNAPVIAQGVDTDSSAVIDFIDVQTGKICTTGPTCEALPAGRYFVSVLPNGQTADDCNSVFNKTYDMGGAPIDTSTQSEVTVYVRENPVETTRISVKVFHDILPLNNAPDAGEIALYPKNHPQEGQPVFPMAGFTVTVGDQGGDIVTDIFGNPLGTTYKSLKLNKDCSPKIDTMGTGDFVTPPNGEVIIENLAPGKYAVQVEPPAVEPGWLQVTTIEGTKTIDAWVRPDEPPFLIEFGPPAWHTFYGFVKEMNNLPFPPSGPTTTVKGEIRKAHSQRVAGPAAAQIDFGPPPEAESVGERCIVGLNSMEAGSPEALWVGKCDDETGMFEIPNVPPGTYDLAVFDVSLLQIISFNTVITGETGGILDLGEIAVPMWFGVHENYVYNDENKNNVRDPGEAGIFDQNINLRFRDGTIYQAFPTDLTGFVPFQEVFPFFHWLVAEVDFAKLQATGVRVVVDEGGPVDFGPFGEGKRNPQDQGGGIYEFIDDGPALTEGFQTFADQNIRFEWGKAPYDVEDFNFVDTSSEANYFASTLGWPGGSGDVDTNVDSTPDGEYQNNGGISGIVFYATTRAEDDPRLAAGEPWEPGVPRVQVSLYRDVWCASNGGPAVYPVCPEAISGEIGDGIPDDKNGNSTVDYADVDNYPLGWADSTADRGPEDVDQDDPDHTLVTDAAAVFDLGDAIRVAWTDSWDDNLPSGCVTNSIGSEPTIHGVTVPIGQCAEGLRTWNQVKPAVFDGGYAFGPGDPLLVPGTYIVAAATPPGYKLVKEEDRNVDFGLTPIPAILPARCVGDTREVPPFFSFVTRNGDGQLPLVSGLDPGNPDLAAPFAGDPRSLCDRKRVDLGIGQNSAADFFLFTDVPIAARGVGIMTGDLTNQTNPNRPDFGEKFSPSWLPIAVFDYTNREIFRTYGDEFGHYNFLAPSTYSINLPTPSGVGPKMHKFCLNHPTMPDGTPDPFYQPQLTTTCYQFNFEAGRVLYLDTPVIRQAAFSQTLNQTLDCELPDHTPMIRDVVNTTTGEPAIIRPGQRLVISSVGTVQVPNPDYPGDTSPADGFPDDPTSAPQFIDRNYGFGASEGEVCVTRNSVGDVRCLDPIIVTWGDDEIVIDSWPSFSPTSPRTGQLTVIDSNGNSTVAGLTLTVANAGNTNIGGAILRVGVGQAFDPVLSPTPIQDAIDAASDGDLILVDPGQYFELPIMYKRVKLQGAGAGQFDVSAGGTVLNASHFGINPNHPTFNPLLAWRNKLELLLEAGEIDLLKEQKENAFGGLDPCKGKDKTYCLSDGQGPGIFVASNPGVHDFGLVGRYNLTTRARIDGFQIRLADTGGAIYVNDSAHRLLISNIRMIANSGNYGGGIRIGNPAVVVGPFNVSIPDGSDNQFVDIRHNQIIENGAVRTGGGVGIYKGATAYRIEDNNFCGNFARSGGGAIAHQGLSDNGLIAGNDIIFNEAFQGISPGGLNFGIGGGGGGIQVAGDLDIVPGGLTEGTGDVTIDKNLIQGNLGGASDGGGIALVSVNGDDVVANPTNDPAGDPWWRVFIFNNMIVNNASGNAGGGISMQDATDVRIIHNTIANNDSTATAAAAFSAGRTNPSTPQPAGIVSRGHSAGLQAFIGNGTTFSQPFSVGRFSKNIFYNNRSFYLDPSVPGLQANPGAFWDLGVVGTGTTDCLNPIRSLLTTLVPTADPNGCNYTQVAPNRINIMGDPQFVSNTPGDLNVYTTGIAADEGGNFAQVFFTPLTPHGDYHLGGLSPAIDALPNVGVGTGRLASDIDGDTRPQGVADDIGADEVVP